MKVWSVVELKSDLFFLSKSIVIDAVFVKSELIVGCGSYGYSFLLLEAGNLTGSDHSGSCSSHTLGFAGDRISRIKSIEWD